MNSSIRQLGLLFIVLFIMMATCNGKEVLKTVGSNIQDATDSIQISVELPPHDYCGFNVRNNLFNNHYLTIVNETEKDSVITKKYPFSFNAPIIYYGVFIMGKGPTKRIRHYYLIDKNSMYLKFKYSKGEIYSMDSSKVTIADELYDAYDKLRSKIFLAKGNSKPLLKKQLDSLYSSFKEKYAAGAEKQLAMLNELHYIDKLQRIYPFAEEVEKFVLTQNQESTIYEITVPIYSTYIVNRKGVLPYSELNRKRYPPVAIKLLSLGLYQFLKLEENLGDAKYNQAREWLKTTDLYRENKHTIDKDITPLDKKEFKKRIKMLGLLTKEFSHTTFSQIVEKNPSPYYLIDFWATWCGPCLDGIGRIHKMKIPQNVKVINLSTDKFANKDKWQLKANETEQKLSYLVDLSKEEGRAFLKFIELQAIPRYILIDKNMNLIDESYLSPSDPGFLLGLRSTKH